MLVFAGTGSDIACVGVVPFDPGVSVDIRFGFVQAARVIKIVTTSAMNFGKLLTVLISFYPAMINKGTGMKVKMNISNVKAASHFRFESIGVI